MADLGLEANQDGGLRVKNKNKVRVRSIGFDWFVRLVRVRPLRGTRVTHLIKGSTVSHLHKIFSFPFFQLSRVQQVNQADITPDFSVLLSCFLLLSILISNEVDRSIFQLHQRCRFLRFLNLDQKSHLHCQKVQKQVFGS